MSFKEALERETVPPLPRGGNSAIIEGRSSSSLRRKPVDCSVCPMMRCIRNKQHTIGKRAVLVAIDIGYGAHGRRHGETTDLRERKRCGDPASPRASALAFCAERIESTAPLAACVGGAGYNLAPRHRSRCPHHPRVNVPARWFDSCGTGRTRSKWADATGSRNT